MIKKMMINFNILAFILKIVFSMMISGTMLILMDTVKDKGLLFIILTALNFISIHSILRIFTTSVTSFYDKIISELHKIQKEYISDTDLSEEKKEVLKYKFIHVREYFIKSVLSLQFLRNNNYSPVTEKEDLIAIAKKTVEMYIDDVLSNSTSNNYKKNKCFVDEFQKIHEPATAEFINKLVKAIFDEKLIWERRRIFYQSLIELMKQSVDDFLKVNTDNC